MTCPDVETIADLPSGYTAEIRPGAHSGLRLIWLRRDSRVISVGPVGDDDAREKAMRWIDEEEARPGDELPY